MGSGSGRQELSGVFVPLRGVLRAALLFSAAVNLLMLTGPVFMLLVYDRVLASQSTATLSALVLMLTALFLAMTVLDIARARLMHRYAFALRQALEPRLFQAMMEAAPDQTSQTALPGAPPAVLPPEPLLAAQPSPSDPGPLPEATIAGGQASPGFEASSRPVSGAYTSGRGPAALTSPGSGHVLRAAPGAPLADLDALSRYYASPGFMALCDLPWVPVFLAATALFHPLLGLAALAGGGVLVAATLANQAAAARALAPADSLAGQAAQLAGRLRARAATARALGLDQGGFLRWHQLRARAGAAQLAGADSAAFWSLSSRSFRLYLQSLILALAAWLVLRGEATPGIMLAASVLTGRALAPVDQLLAHWPVLVRARSGRAALEALLDRIPPSVPRLPLPPPEARLSVRGLSLTLPGAPRPLLTDLRFDLAPGQALAVVGASGAGKSTLARCLTGAMPAPPGSIWLGGAPLPAWDRSLPRHIGYLPQQTLLMAGTIAANIARLALQPDPAALIRAASLAGLHTQILALPQGYDTWIDPENPCLSGGMLQRLALARALYGDPPLVILDEPDAGLDHEGASALSRCIHRLRQESKAVILMSHRPAAIRDCDLLLVLEAGQARAFGPKDQILRWLMTEGPQPQTAAQTGLRPGPQPQEQNGPQTEPDLAPVLRHA